MRIIVSGKLIEGYQNTIFEKIIAPTHTLENSKVLKGEYDEIVNK